MRPEDHLWKEQMRTSIRTYEELQNFLSLSSPQPIPSQISYKLFLPKHLAQLIKDQGPQSPLWKQFIPSADEDEGSLQDQGSNDPIGDHHYAKKGQIIHRYKNRLLFTPTSLCPIACRYCFRKNELSSQDPLFDPDFSATLLYLQNHPEVCEIIFSGGDPLVLSDEKLKFYLESFQQFPHIKYIRFHSRTPIVLPSRITLSFLSLLKNFQKNFQKIQLVIHVNHRDELYPEVEAGLQQLYHHGIEILAQTVLLRGVNDTLPDLIQLFTALVDMNIRPYYLHHPDRVKGGMHFYLPLEKGRELYAGLKDNLPGWAIPHYMLDIPGGEGKIWAFNPETFTYSGQMINRHGKTVNVQEIENLDQKAPG